MAADVALLPGTRKGTHSENARTIPRFRQALTLCGQEGGAAVRGGRAAGRSMADMGQQELFKAHGQHGDGDARMGEPSGAAELSLAQVFAEPKLSSPVLSIPDRLRESLTGWRDTIESRWTQLDLVHDLAEDIGSRRWYRGLGTMFGLGAVALAFWPNFSAVEAATTMPARGNVRDEFRSQMIMPLALGADSGRRMGATDLVRPLASVPERPVVQIVSTLGAGDSLTGMLTRAGVSSADAAGVTGLVGNTLPLSAIATGTRFDITLGQRSAPGAPRALEAIDFRARFDLDLGIERGGGGRLVLVRRPVTVDTTPLRIRGTVGSSLYRSARNAGAPVAAIQSYLRAVDQQMSLDELSPTDEFDIIVSYKRSARGERQTGELLYAGIERGGKPRLQMLRWGKDGQMFAASGIGQTRSVTIGQPVMGRMTSSYGLRRHPILGYMRMHSGIDFGASLGTPIYAVADGVVAFAGRHGGHGNYVRLNHAGGTGTGYAHMSRIAVSPGTMVQSGQVIGYVGSTGLSTGPHLHFEAYQAGRTINPASLRFLSRPQVDGLQIDGFKKRLASLLTVRPGEALGAVGQTARAVIADGREIDRAAPLTKADPKA